MVLRLRLPNFQILFPPPLANVMTPTNIEGILFHIPCQIPVWLLLAPAKIRTLILWPATQKAMWGTNVSNWFGNLITVPFLFHKLKWKCEILNFITEVSILYGHIFPIDIDHHLFCKWALADAMVKTFLTGRETFWREDYKISHMRNAVQKLVPTGRSRKEACAKLHIYHSFSSKDYFYGAAPLGATTPSHVTSNEDG